MTPEAQRIAIAEACGWKRLPPDVDFGYRWQKGSMLTNWSNKEPSPFPDYLNDLNAMHEAEKVLTAEQQDVYACVLEEMIAPDFLGDQTELDPHIIMFRDIHATATQRAEAFLRTLGKWTETDASHLSKVESNTAQH